MAMPNQLNTQGSTFVKVGEYLGNSPSNGEIREKLYYVLLC